MNKKTFFRTFFVGLTVAVMLPTLVLAVVSDVDPDDGGAQCVSLNFNLKYRSRDANTNGEVSTLQDFLQSQNYLSSEPTGYFGILTLKAVKDFQRDNGITPTGYVGPITRAKINALCGDVSSGGGGGGGGGGPVNHGSITVLSPNSSTIWTKGQNNTISWTATRYPSSGYVALVLQDASGTTVGIIKNIFFSTTQPINNQSYVWDTQTLTSIGTDANGVEIPPCNIQTGGKYAIRVGIIDYNTVPAGVVASSDSSLFTIVSSTPTIYSILPAGCPSATVYSSITGEYCGNARVGDMVYVNGTNFNSNSRMWLDSGYTNSEDGRYNAIATTFISSNRLSFLAFDHYGTGIITVLVGQTRSSLSNAVRLNIIIPQTSNITITTPSPLPNAKVGANYQTILGVARGSTNLSISEATNGFTWTVVDGYVPPGLFLSGSADIGPAITGRPTVAGTYTFSINATNSSQTVIKQFTLTVDPADVTPTNALSVSHSSLNFTAFAEAQGTTLSQPIVLTNTSTQSIKWTRTSSANWLSTYGSAGTIFTGSGFNVSPELPVTINTTGLAVGTYNGTLTFSPNSGSNFTPQTVLVTLNITAGYRYLQVKSTSNSWVAWNEIQAYDGNGNLLTPVSCTPMSGYQSTCIDVYPGRGGYWNSGGYSGTITLDYGSDKNITQVKLLPSNSPTLANATHTVSAWADGASEGSATVLKTFSGHIQDQVWLTYQSPIAQSNASQLASILDALKSALASLKKSLQ